MSFLGLLLVLAAASAVTRAATPLELFNAANSAYESADYERAIAEYEKILAYGLHDPRVHYNLGNAYFKLGRLGPSILHYERALKLRPSDLEARDNLDLARSQIRDRVADPEVQFPLSAIKRVLDVQSTNGAAMVFLVLFLPAAGLSGAIPLVRDDVRRRVLGYSAVIVGLCALVALGALVYKAADASAERVIVMQERVNVRSGPGEGNIVLFTVHEGTRLEVRSRLEGWFQVSLPNAMNGWIPEIAVEQV